MANPVNIVLRDLETGAGRVGLTVTMRHVTDNYATDVYTMAGVMGKAGVYTVADVAYNKYKFFINGTEDDTIPAQWLPSDEGRLRKVTDESGTYWECENLEFRSAAATTEANSLIRKSEADERYVKVGDDIIIPTTKKIIITDPPTSGDSGVNRDYADTKMVASGSYTLSGNNLFTGSNSFTGGVALRNTNVISGYKLSLADLPESPEHAANMRYVDIKFAEVETMPYQTGPNVIRLIPNGINQTNKVYNTYAGAIANAVAFATASRRYTIDIEGAGTAGVEIIASATPKTFPDFVSLKGKNQNVELYVGDDTYTIGVLGRSIIENVTLTLEDDGATPVFQNFVFKDVIFKMEVASLSFVNCEFRGHCIVKNVDGSIVFDENTKGGYVRTNASAISDKMDGKYGIDPDDLCY